jgi:hypothetical protein
MRRISFAFAAIFFCALAVRSGAETLPLNSELLRLDSLEGEELLIGAEARADYLPLSVHFTTQINPAFCGPATIAMVLNALGVPRPASDMTLGLGLFDQVNLFDARTEAVKPQAEILQGGMTLDELGAILGSYGLKVDVVHASDSNLEEFRQTVVDDLADREGFVLVNYLRRAIGQESGGHISPLAAYDADTDRFLILDVSRYKYPPVWVEAEDLFGAMDTPDSDNGNRSRGYVIVRR